MVSLKDKDFDLDFSLTVAYFSMNISFALLINLQAWRYEALTLLISLSMLLHRGEIVPAIVLHFIPCLLTNPQTFR